MSDIQVNAGQDLQAVLNVAQPGDTVTLEAGASFTGNFVLPVKTGDQFVTVRSSRLAELPAGRVNLSHASLMARVETPNVGPVLLAPVFTHHFKFQGLEFTQGAAVGQWGYNLIQMGEGATYENQNTLESVPHHFEFDRVIVRARDANTGLQRGITLNSAHTSITNSYFSDIKMAGTETQALGGWNGPGPYLIENNYMEAAGITVLFGGAPTAIPDLIPSDITIRHNTFTKRLEWQGKGYSCKNLFELKNARRVKFIENDCQYSWPDAQTGWAVILNAFRDSPQNVIDDVEIGGNTFRDVANGINLRGMESDDTATRMHRINIHDNLIENVGAFSGEGKVFQLLNGTEDVEINHNTVNGKVGSAVILQSLPIKHVRFKFLNNLSPHGTYGVFGDGGYFGSAALNQYCADWQFEKNALYAMPSGLDSLGYPPGNYFPATLTDTQGLMGTDGQPVGVRTSPPPIDPTPIPPTPPTLKKVAWPKTEGAQDKVLADQWALGFRLKRNLSGAYAEFEKVK